MGLPTYVNMLHHVAQITTCLFEVRTSLTALLQCLMLPLLYPFPTSISASQLRVGQSYAITRSTLVFFTVVKIRLCITVQLDNYDFLLLCCVIRSSLLRCQSLRTIVCLVCAKSLLQFLKYQVTWSNVVLIQLASSSIPKSSDILYTCLYQVKPP